MRQPASDGAKFDSRTAVLLGLGFLGITMVGPIFNTFVPIFLREMGLQSAMIGFVLTWDNYINLLAQPLVGLRSDRTWTRFGRRKPWILAGAPFAVAGFSLIPAMPTIGGIMATILLTNLALASFRSPAVALLGDLFPECQQSTANGIINFMGGLGAISSFLAGRALYRFGPAYPFLFGAAVMFAMLIVVLLFVREPPVPVVSTRDGSLRSAVRRLRDPEGRNTLRLLAAITCWTVGYSALEAWASSFGKYSLGIREDYVSGMMAALALSFVACALPCGLLAAKVGKRRVCAVGVAGLTVLFAYGCFIRSPAMFLGFLIPAGIFWAMITVTSLPLVYEVGSWGDKGTMTGLYYLSGSLALIVGPIFVGLLIDLTGGYRSLFVFSALFMAVAAFLLSRVHSVISITAAPNVQQ